MRQQPGTGRRRLTALALLLGAGLLYTLSFGADPPLSYAFAIAGVALLVVAVAVAVGGYRSRRT